MRILTIALLMTASGAVSAQTNPTLTAWEQALTDATQAGEMEATIGRLVGTGNNLVSLCTLDGAVTRIRCYHSTQTTAADGHRTVVHSEPAEYDGEALSDVLASEQAWVHGGTHPLHMRESFR